MKKILIVIAVMCLARGAVAQEIPGTPPPGPQDRSHLAHVVVVSMGGAIASHANDRMNLTNYGGKGAARVTPADWLHDLPELNNLAQITTVDMTPAPGVSDDFGDMSRVAKKLNELAADPSVGGIVVTHDTNTLAEAAFYFNLTVNTDKPIVLVGSQRPWSGISGDGPLNLYDAVHVAASPLASGKGVLVCMNQDINPARDVTMTIAYRVEAFEGVDVGALGFADPDKIVFYRAPSRKHTTNSEFAGKDFKTLPPVEVFYAYTDAPGYVIDAAVAHGVKGIVLDGFGPGDSTSSERAAIERAQAKGVVVVITARTRGGRVQETKREDEAKLVPGDNLPPEKARILLQLALTKTSNWRQIKQYFEEY
jgi:L-asparaginase